MTNFCVLAYVNGRPVSADRLMASSPAEAVRMILRDRQLSSCEVYEGRRVVAVVDDGLITIAGVTNGVTLPVTHGALDRPRSTARPA